MSGAPRSRRWKVRRSVQVGVLAFLLAIPLLAAAEIPFISGTLCSLGFDWFSVSCPVGVAQTTVASGEVHWPLIFSAVPLLVLAVVFGRVFCSWVCPQGFASEVADSVRTRLGGSWWKRTPDSPARARRGRRLLWTVVAAVVIGSVVFEAPVLCYVCPIGLICRSLVDISWFGVVGAEVLIVALIILAEVTIARRGWCKYLCPVGALYGACATPKSLQVSRHPSSCVGCHTCERECPMGNSPLRDEIRPTCTNCALCLDGCPATALRLKFGRPKPEGPEEVVRAGRPG